MLSLRQALKVANGVIKRVFVLVVNLVTFWNWPIVKGPNVSMQPAIAAVGVRGVAPIIDLVCSVLAGRVAAVNDAVEFNLDDSPILGRNWCDPHDSSVMSVIGSLYRKASILTKRS